MDFTIIILYSIIISVILSIINFIEFSLNSDAEFTFPEKKESEFESNVIFLVIDW
jgi:hypothetical protein